MSPHDNPHHERRWAILAVLGIAQLMVVLDATIVNIALPQAQSDLGFSVADRQWIVTAYSLAFGSLLLLGGKLSDLFGRKWTFIIGLIGFAVASAIGGASQSFIMLAVARAAQGAFGALLAPGALSLLTTTFTDGSERNKAFGIYGAIAGSGASFGLLLGGILTQELSWRWCLYVNLAFAVFAVAGALILLHNVAEEKKPRIDWPGTVAVSVGLFAVVFGFNRAEVDGWTAGVTLISLVVGIVLLIAFVMIQLRARFPLLPMRVPGDRNRGGAFLAMLLSAAAMFGVFLFLTYYLQQNEGYSPIKTGVAFLPLSGTIMITAVLGSTVLAPRIGPKVLVSLGMLLSGIGMALFTRIGLHTHFYDTVLPGEIVMALGLGLVFSMAMNGATIGVRPSDAGVASALVNACQQVGGAVGTALLSTIFASATANYASSHASEVGSGGVSKLTLGSLASIHGYTVAFWVSAGIFAAGALASAFLFTRDARVVVDAPAGEAGEAAERQPALMH